MRISFQTLAMLLVCFLGGVAVYVSVGVKYAMLTDLQERYKNNAVLVRDIQYLEHGLAQWFVNLDLFFSHQEGYLANGIQLQAETLQEVVMAVQGNIQQTAESPDSLNALGEQMLTISRTVKKVSVLKNAEGKEWDKALKEADELSFNIAENVEALSDQVSNYAEISQLNLDQEEEEFYRFIIVSILIYVVICIAVWRWATVNLVKPLENLIARSYGGTGYESHGETVFGLKKGPKEVLQLASSLTDFASRIQKERKKAITAKEIVSTIMNTAPSAIISTDRYGEIKTANDFFQKIFDVEPKDVVGESINRIVENIDLASLSGGQPVRLEFEAIKYNGERFPIEISASGMNTPSGYQYTLIIQDISERKAQEKELKILNQRLIDTSRQAGIAEIAASILHNIGNVLNSVNTSVTMLSDSISKSRVQGLNKAVGLMQDNADDLAGFFSDEAKGKQLYQYFGVLNEQLTSEQCNNKDEIECLKKNIKHIESIISSQQQYAHHSGVIEEICIQELIEESINMNISDIDNYGIRIIKEFDVIDNVQIDRHKLMQIVINLIRNAKDALVESKAEDPEVKITVKEQQNNLAISIFDNGIGMSQETQDKLFSFGFTTKKDGHGFGLHSCSLEAKNLGGLLKASSEGIGKGACFTLEIPLVKKG